MVSCQIPWFVFPFSSSLGLMFMYLIWAFPTTDMSAHVPTPTPPLSRQFSQSTQLCPLPKEAHLIATSARDPPIVLKEIKSKPMTSHIDIHPPSLASHRTRVDAISLLHHRVPSSGCGIPVSLLHASRLNWSPKCRKLGVDGEERL